MKHVICSDSWRFRNNAPPISFYEIVGSSFRGHVFTLNRILVSGIEPEYVYCVYPNNSAHGKKTLYVGKDKSEAQAVLEAYNVEMAEKVRRGEKKKHLKGSLKTDLPLLPEGNFKVGCLSNSRIFVESGEDKTDRCFLFISSNNNYFGSLEFAQEYTDGRMLWVGSELNFGLSIHGVAILEVGQSVAVRKYSNVDCRIVTLRWTGKEIEKEEFVEDRDIDLLLKKPEKVTLL